MKRQIVQKIVVLALTLSIGVCSTALAQEKKPDTTQDGETKKLETNKDCHDCHRKHDKARMMGGRVFEKIGITKEEVQKAKKDGKTMFDLAKEKGYTETQVKEMIIKDKTEALNKAVEDHKITREEADAKILKVKEKVSKWDGTFKDHKEEKHKSEQN